MSSELRVGDAVLFRNVYDGRVTSCYPCRYVGDWDGRWGLYCQPGSQVKLTRRAGESYLERWIDRAKPFDSVWSRTQRLRFVRRGDAHTVEVFWDEEWNFLGWYANLQAPIAVRGDRLDTTDHALDIWVEPDGSWEWKDERDFAEAQELGILAAAAAAEVRAEGERVFAERPWPTGWEDWRPPAEWKPLALPEDWHVV
jgi:hypothetical protein